MVYKKRRYNRRYKNKTKKFNKYAYAKTDSRNQAKQIVQLNKKISNVYKTLKPEMIKLDKAGEFKLSSAAISVTPFGTLLEQTPNTLFKGNYTKFIYYNFKFFFNSTDIDLTQGKTLRVAILQARYGTNNKPNGADIFQDTTQSIISPFKRGINTNYKILLNKNYIISSDRDYLYKSYNFKKLIGYNKFYKNTTDNINYPRGTIFVVFATTQTTEFTIKYNNALGYVDN